MKFFTRLTVIISTLMALFFTSNASAITPDEQYNKYAINKSGAMFNGWVQSNYYVTPRPITSMNADFLVPSNGPKNSVGQVNYLFPAVTTTDWSAIIQPVLTSSNNVNEVHYKNSQWTMNGWYVTHDSNGKEVVNKSKQVIVSPGDKITTKTYRTNIRNKAGNYQWNIYMKDITSGKVSTFSTFVKETVFNYSWPAVMESYYIVKCGDFITSPFTVTNFHTYDVKGRDMYTHQMEQYNPGENVCNPKVIQNTAGRLSTLTINNFR